MAAPRMKKIPTEIISHRQAGGFRGTILYYAKCENTSRIFEFYRDRFPNKEMKRKYDSIHGIVDEEEEEIEYAKPKNTKRKRNEATKNADALMTCKNEPAPKRRKRCVTKAQPKKKATKSSAKRSASKARPSIIDDEEKRLDEIGDDVENDVLETPRVEPRSILKRSHHLKTPTTIKNSLPVNGSSISRAKSIPAVEFKLSLATPKRMQEDGKKAVEPEETDEGIMPEEIIENDEFLVFEAPAVHSRSILKRPQQVEASKEEVKENSAQVNESVISRAKTVPSVTFSTPRASVAPSRRIEEEAEEPEEIVEDDELMVLGTFDVQHRSIQKPPLSQRPTIVEEIPLSVDDIIIRTGMTTSSSPLPVYQPDRTKPKPSVPKHYMDWVDDNLKRTLISAKQLDPLIDYYDKTQANYRRDMGLNEKKLTRLGSMENKEIDQINELKNKQIEIERRIEEVEEMKMQVLNDRAFLYTSYQRMIKANRYIFAE